MRDAALAYTTTDSGALRSKNHAQKRSPSEGGASINMERIRREALGRAYGQARAGTRRQQRRWRYVGADVSH